ncbi:MAG TPA: hypothetical protein VGV59_09185 [Pyrinomonadaceae bacterium]|nr:hypothetical protein [Pyrinomonadaceae bacterium]
MASRVAAELEKEKGVSVETVAGGFGEFRVSVDEREVVDTNRFWFPTPSKVVDKVRAALADSGF